MINAWLSSEERVEFESNHFSSSPILNEVDPYMDFYIGTCNFSLELCLLDGQGIFLLIVRVLFWVLTSFLSIFGYRFLFALEAHFHISS